MHNFTFTRWRKFGHDRLYIADALGTKLGHVDLATGVGAPEPGQDQEHLELLAKAWQQTAGAKAPVRTQPVTAGVDKTEAGSSQSAAAKPTVRERSNKPRAETPAFDLAYYEAGHAARTKAHEERERIRTQHPVASRVAPLIGVATPDKSWAKGAAGEQEVGARLEKLKAKGWHVLHSVPVGTRGSDIDHLLIGPAGVFSINTKNHTGGKVWVGDRAIMVNGKKTRYLRNSRFEGERVSKILTEATGWRIDVIPVLVFLAADFTVRSRPPEVAVLRRSEVPRRFEKLPATISNEAVERIYGFARHSKTWQP